MKSADKLRVVQVEVVTQHAVVFETPPVDYLRTLLEFLRHPETPHHHFEFRFQKSTAVVDCVDVESVFRNRLLLMALLAVLYLSQVLPLSW